jgi:hypothetical protein
MVKINKRSFRVLLPRPLRELRGGDEVGEKLIAPKTIIIDGETLRHSEVHALQCGAPAPVFAANTVHYDTSPLSDGSLFA